MNGTAVIETKTSIRCVFYIFIFIFPQNGVQYCFLPYLLKPAELNCFRMLNLFTEKGDWQMVNTSILNVKEKNRYKTLVHKRTTRKGWIVKRPSRQVLLHLLRQYV